MEDLKKQSIEMLTQIGTIVIPLLIALGAAYKTKLIALVKAKIDTIGDEKLRTAANNAFNTLDTLIETNVVSAENKLKPVLLAAIADGKITKDELSNLSTIVKDDVLKQLGTDATNALSNSIGDLDSFVAARVEKILADLKDAEGTAVTKTVIPEVNTETVNTAALQQELADAKAKLEQVQSLIIPAVTSTTV